MKNGVGIFLSLVLMAICVSFSLFWVAVSFIAYEVTDKPFQWWSILALVVSFLVFIILLFISLIQAAEQKDKMDSNKLYFDKKGVYKSKFQERLEQRAKEDKK